MCSNRPYFGLVGGTFHQPAECHCYDNKDSKRHEMAFGDIKIASVLLFSSFIILLSNPGNSEM